MGKKSVPPILFFPIIEGKNIQRVKIYPIHCNKMGKKESVSPTLFFPIIEGKNIQRVKIYPNP